jgi:hypothetical protein
MSGNPLPEATQAVVTPGGVDRRELAAALLIQAALALLFLSPALFTGRYFSPSDLLFTLAPWSDQPPAGWTGPGNWGQFDATYVFEPWLRYTAAALHSGRLPLWNADNYLGAPFIGNIQSAVFYPGNWLYYLWPGGAMYALRAWLQLLIAALGMYGLARQSFGTSRVGAHLAAITFTYGAFVILWLSWPLTSVAIWLPWLWWATARLMARPSARRIVGLALLVVISIFAGHPETAFHLALFTGPFALFCAWRAALGQPGRGLRLLGLWLAGCGAGVLCAAIQLGPFLEYMAQSQVLIWRSAAGHPRAWIPPAHAWTFLSPDLFGTPVLNNEWDTRTSYVDTNVYSGWLPLLLAPLALLTRSRAQRAGALLMLGLAGLAAGAVYHLPGIYDLAVALPGLGLSANRRLVIFFPFALGLLAALGLDTLRQEGAARRVVLTGAATGLILLGGGILPLALGERSLFQVPTELPGTDAIWQAGLWRAVVVGAVSAGALAGIGGWRGRGAAARKASAVWLVIPALLFADLWQARGHYNPTIMPADHFPDTPVTRFLQQQPAGTRFVGIGGAFPPNTNLRYNLTDLRGYDALEVHLYRDLVMQIDPTLVRRPGGLGTLLQTVRSPLINLLGARYVVAAPNDDPNYQVVAQQETPGASAGELLPGRQVGQTFVAPADRLAGVQLLVANYARPTQGRLRFHLKTDPAAPTDLASGEVDAATWPNNQFWPIFFPPVSGSAGRTFYFGLEGVDTQPGSAPTLWFSPQDVYAGGTRWEQGQPVAGDFAFRLVSRPEAAGAWFAPVLDGGAHGTSVYENRRAFPRAWLTHRIEVEPDSAARPARLADPAFDAHGTALLAAPLPADRPLPASAPPPAQDTVTITHNAPEMVAIATDSPAAGLLILADQAFPGWTATVDGQAAPLVTADHALRGVYVPAGSHMVRFSYEPLSFRLGALVSGVTLLILGILGVGWRPRRRLPGHAAPAS